MTNTVQEFLARATQKTAADLEAALLKLPEERRNWSPGGEARTAADMVAECAILSGTTADTIINRTYPPDFDWAAYTQHKAELAQNWPALKALFHENVARFVALIQATPAEELTVEVPMPWGPMTVTQLLTYPSWNMTYHEGQINYIASLPAA